MRTCPIMDQFVGLQLERLCFPSFALTEWMSKNSEVNGCYLSQYEAQVETVPVLLLKMDELCVL